MKESPSLSKSALILSPCLAWTHKSAKWYDDRFSDVSDREAGTRFHKAIDEWLKQHQTEKSKTP